MVFEAAGRKARGIVFSRLTTAAAARPCCLARSFSFSPPTTPTELSRFHSEAKVTSASPSVTSSRLSLNTQAPCSTVEFSRPPPQLAGSPPVSRPGQKAPRALPTLRSSFPFLFIRSHHRFLCSFLSYLSMYCAVQPYSTQK